MYQNHKVKVFRRTAIGAALVVAGLSAGPALAQTTLEEVVVTAQKRAQGANDVGITINTFTGDQIRDLGVFTPEDIAQYTPGLTVNDTAATGVPIYTIRGVGFQDYSTAASSTVGIYMDEVAMPYTVMTRGLVFDTERVEVLKGPQGDLYGRNTTAGQINFISNKPTKEFGAGITASFANYETYEFEGFVTGGTDFAQGRLAFKTTQSNEGWQESTTRNDDLGEKDVSALRGIVNFDFSDAVRLQLIASYVTDESENRANSSYDGRDEGLAPFSNPYTPLDEYFLPTGSNFGQEPPWFSTDDNEKADWTNSYTSEITGRTFDLRPQRDNESLNFAARLDWNLDNGMTFTSITGYSDFEREEANDWDGGFYNDSSNINTTDLDVFSQELRLSGSSDDTEWIVGLYYSKDEMDEYYHYFMSDSVFGYGSIPWGVGLFAPTPILELDTIYEQETESAAIFGHVEWSFTDNWRLTLGARYTEEERDWSGCTRVADDGSLGDFLNAQFGSTLAPGDCGTIDDDPTSPGYIFNVAFTPNANDAFPLFEETIDTDKWMGKIGLDYTVNDDILVYGMISRGFKSGGFNGANSNTTQQLAPYKEEELTSYEVGVKATLLDGSMQLNAATFFYDYEDKQEQDLAVTFVNNISGLTNIPESEIYGVELDLKWLITDGLQFNLGASWLDTEVKEWDAVDGDLSAWPVTVTRDVSGAELPAAPELQVSSLLSYTFDVSDSLYMEVAGDVNYTDSLPGDIRAEEATDSYTIVNARVSLGADDGKWRAMLWARNLTDEDYFPSAYTGGNGPYVRSYGMPLTYGVTLSYYFGE